MRLPKCARAFRRVAAHAGGQPHSAALQAEDLLEANREDIARTITNECGKTLPRAGRDAARHRKRRDACGMPIMMQGTNTEDIAAGIDEHMIRQPLGVVAAITPFNFPGMIPFWFLPYAVAAGNCFCSSLPSACRSLRKSFSS
jgi:acyl-CoA reductase-like NAD-dependent aldehyde dehydrogenase